MVGLVSIETSNSIRNISRRERYGNLCAEFQKRERERYNERETESSRTSNMNDWYREKDRGRRTNGEWNFP